ncbi:hypothetical protein [Pseudanabaena sp. PCC 6802]|uniref:hypothetical protein n=1 Tax=Pseudanabaena sp. PCC 6802 TaxID=118173 RepID=UPI000346B207|nr:hypothetical protein [Pseudanabaena sp. PCC 6802]
MSQHIITELTDGQKEILAVYRVKWQNIAVSTKLLDKEKVIEIIEAAYAESSYPKPEILFYSSPQEAVRHVLSVKEFKTYLGRSINTKFLKRVLHHSYFIVKQQLDKNLFINLQNQIQFPISPHYPTEQQPQISVFPDFYTALSCLENKLIDDLGSSEKNIIDISYCMNSLAMPVSWATWVCMSDFCISVLAVRHDRKKWKVIQDLIQSCDFIFQFEKVCLVCNNLYKFGDVTQTKE